MRPCGRCLLSFLPLSHTLERTAGYYCGGGGAASPLHARGSLMEICALFATVLISVRESTSGLRRAARSRGGSFRQTLDSGAAIDLGWRRFEYAQHRAPRPSCCRLAWPLLDRVVGAPLRDRFGGRLRAAVAAARRCRLSSPPFSRWRAGAPRLCMTESAPVVSCNTPVDNDPATVGRPLPSRGSHRRGGECCARRQRDDGYWQRPSIRRCAQQRRLAAHGDLAYWKMADPHQRRIKDIIVTSTGRSIAGRLEAAILDDPMFDQAM